jgi:hypothetical protein
MAHPDGERRGAMGREAWFCLRASKGALDVIYYATPFALVL